ncbi:mitochondrial 54S ribosomal protein YmL27 [Martiniozyma asiatica (nom. inval.)]|nr:mitochondrial 54S ribosomal protein YmL27 [Martiniozyma asiatica]
MLTRIQTRAFHHTPASLLKRPWKKDRDGTIFYGSSKTGNKRLPLTSKQGNKNFYKGNGASRIGSLDLHGGYHIKYNKVRTFIVPEEATTVLKPLVSPNCPIPKASFKGYTGPADGKLYWNKVKEYIKDGEAKYEVTETYLEKY